MVRVVVNTFEAVNVAEYEPMSAIVGVQLNVPDCWLGAIVNVAPGGTAAVSVTPCPSGSLALTWNAIVLPTLPETGFSTLMTGARSPWTMTATP